MFVIEAIMLIISYSNPPWNQPVLSSQFKVQNHIDMQSTKKQNRKHLTRSWAEIYVCYRLYCITWKINFYVFFFSASERILATAPNVEVLNDVLFMEILQPVSISYTYKIRLAKNFGTSFVSTDLLNCHMIQTV